MESAETKGAKNFRTLSKKVVVVVVVIVVVVVVVAGGLCAVMKEFILKTQECSAKDMY